MRDAEGWERKGDVVGSYIQYKRFLRAFISLRRHKDFKTPNPRFVEAKRANTSGMAHAMAFVERHHALIKDSRDLPEPEAPPPAVGGTAESIYGAAPASAPADEWSNLSGGDSGMSLFGGSNMRRVKLPRDAAAQFMQLAAANTADNRETCAVLCGACLSILLCMIFGLILTSFPSLSARQARRRARSCG